MGVHWLNNKARLSPAPPVPQGNRGIECTVFSRRDCVVMSSEGNYFSLRSEDRGKCKSQKVRCSVFLMLVQEVSARVYPAQTPLSQ